MQREIENLKTIIVDSTVANETLKNTIVEERRDAMTELPNSKRYYKGNQDELLRIRQEKLRMGRISRKETNMRDIKGGTMIGATP